MDYYGGVSGLHTKKNTNFGRPPMTTKQSERKHNMQTGIKTVNVKNLYVDSKNQNFGSYINFVLDDDLDSVQNSIMALIKWMWDVSIEQTPDLDNRLHNLMDSVQQRCKSDVEFANIVDQLYNFQQAEPKNQSGTSRIYHACLDHQFFNANGLDNDYVEIFKKYLNIYGDSQNYLKLYALSQTITEQTLTIKDITATQAFYQNEYIIYTDPNLEAGYCSVVCDKCGAKIVDNVDAFVEYLEKVYRGEDIGEQLSSSHYINCGNQFFTKIGVGIAGSKSDINSYEFIGLGDPTELARLQWKVLPDFSILGEVFDDQSSQYLSGYSRKRKLFGMARTNYPNDRDVRRLLHWHRGSVIDDVFKNIPNIENFQNINDDDLIQYLERFQQFAQRLQWYYQVSFNADNDKIIDTHEVFQNLINHINNISQNRGQNIVNIANNVKTTLKNCQKIGKYLLYIRLGHLKDLNKQLGCLYGNQQCVQCLSDDQFQDNIDTYNIFSQKVLHLSNHIKNKITHQLKNGQLNKNCIYQQQHQIQLIDDGQSINYVYGRLLNQYKAQNGFRKNIHSSLQLVNNFPDVQYFNKQFIKYMMTFSIIEKNLIDDDAEYNRFQLRYNQNRYDVILNNIVHNIIAAIDGVNVIENGNGEIILQNIIWNQDQNLQCNITLVQHNGQQNILKISQIQQNIIPQLQQQEILQQIRNTNLPETIYFYRNVDNMGITVVRGVFVNHGLFYIDRINGQIDALLNYKYFLPGGAQDGIYVKLLFYGRKLYHQIVQLWGNQQNDHHYLKLYMGTSAVYSLITNIWLHRDENDKIQYGYIIQYIANLLHDQDVRGQYTDICLRLLAVLDNMYNAINPVQQLSTLVKQIISTIVLYSMCFNQQNPIMYRYMENQNVQHPVDVLQTFKDQYELILQEKYLQLTQILRDQQQNLPLSICQQIYQYLLNGQNIDVLMNNENITLFIDHLRQLFGEQP